MKVSNSDIERMLKLSPGGNPNEVAFIINSVIGQVTYKGDIITIDYLYESYYNYILWWNKTYKGKFFKDDKRLRNLYEYIQEKLYEQSFDISGRTDSRATYLFGDYDELMEKHKVYIQNFYEQEHE